MKPCAGYIYNIDTNCFEVCNEEPEAFVHRSISGHTYVDPDTIQTETLTSENIPRLAKLTGRNERELWDAYHEAEGRGTEAIIPIWGVNE